MRGTIRLNGWAKAWDPVFKEIETLSGPSGDARLAEMAAEFLKDNAYAPGEPDRVILFVSLKAERDGKAVFHETWAMDAWGDEKGTAMGRLVSMPVSFAVETVLAKAFTPGVHTARPTQNSRKLAQLGARPRPVHGAREARLVGAFRGASRCAAGQISGPSSG